MSSSLKEGAFFIADAHYSSNKPILIELLERILYTSTKPPQIFFMGDTFDFLSAYVTASIVESQRAIDLINALSKEIEITLLEGNHDFNLKPLFPDCTVIERKHQPFVLKAEDIAVELSHGDYNMGGFYEIYRFLVEQKLLLKPLDFIDQKWQKKISGKIYRHLETKQLCKELTNMKEIVQKRLETSKASVLIEGHLHQEGIYIKNEKKYVATPALICKKSFFVVESLENGLSFVLRNMKEI